MADRVPGGRQRLGSDGDSIDNDYEGNLYSGDLTAEKHRQIGHYSKTTSEMENKKLVNGGENLSIPGSLDRKKLFRRPSIRSVGNFMNKMVKQVNSLTIGRKPRSRSMTRISDNDDNDKVRSPSLHSLQNDENKTQFNGKTPGISGLRNHGNTCFMNAVLQCLSNTDLFAEYFVTDLYKEDISRHNKSNAKKFGTKGELTEQLSLLLKSLWSCQYSPEISSEFKTVVGKYGSQYKGYAQHDAQEFLLWLLDKVHEDLNTAGKKKYRANKSSKGRSDESVAAEALANHMRLNSSFVYEIFHALYRSSLECPSCHGKSTTFDPFVCVSLPIPQRTSRPVYVTVVYLDAHPKQVRIGLSIEADATVKQLRQMIASDTRISPEQLILCDIYYNGYNRTFYDAQSVSEIHEADNLYAIEFPTQSKANSKEDSGAGNLILLVLNMQGIGNQGKKFGSPLLLTVPRDCDYDHLHEDILSHMLDDLKSSNIILQERSLFRLRVFGGLQGKSYISSDLDLPLFSANVEKALSDQAKDGGPVHLKLYAEWEPHTKQQFLNTRDDVRDEHFSVRQVKFEHQQPALANLQQCFELYTREEKLGSDDAWKCPNCKKLQQGTTKTLGLWSLPEVMVVHLKRFKQTGVKRSKLNTLVDFPVSGLDMSHHVLKRNHSQAHWSPWRRQRYGHHHDDEYVYDLYAVCNHYGNMQGGHYTAFCRNPANGSWYSFDDQKVTPVNENQVVTRAAYMLFYQRRSSQSSTSSTCSISCDHWVYRISSKDLMPKNSTKSQSQDDLLDGGKNSWSEEQASETRDVSLTVQACATLPRPVKSGAQSVQRPFSPTSCEKQSTPTTNGEMTRSATADCLERSEDNLKAGTLSFDRSKSVDPADKSLNNGINELPPDELYPHYSSCLTETAV